MASHDDSARLRYLNDSAHLLVLTAPATSRYLMSRCNSLAFESGIELQNSQRQRICGACGNIIISGWQATVKVQSLRPGKQNGVTRREKSSQRKDMVYKCDSCSRSTRINIPPAGSRNNAVSLGKRPTNAKPHSTPLQPKAGSTPSVPTSSNSSSRKRAKARKNGGLEAILANKQASEARASGFGFDDFFKKA